MVLVTSTVLACFSIPTDIKQQTIFTVVTKPAQKIEIVLGRILGLIALMTSILAVSGAVSLIYVARGVDPEVAKNIRARNVAFGTMYFLDVAPQWSAGFQDTWW
jgi:ABC-type transport system involved in multi-copper enzyme maturation permease subunit